MRAKSNSDESRSVDSAASDAPSAISRESMTEVNDELFMAIRQHPNVRRLCERIEFLCQFLLLFGLLFLVFGVVSIFYKHKSALTMIGIVSLLHVIAGPLGLVAVRNSNRYMLLSLALLNIIWMGIVTLILVIFVFFKPTTDPSKQVFNREILIHVGMFVYMPIAGYTALYGFYMLNELSKVRNELTVMIQENQSRKVTTTPKKAIPTDIFQSFKEVAKNSAEMKPKQIELKPK